MQPRSTSGIVSRPLLIYWILAAWLNSSPIESRMKSTNIKSTIGRVPVIAAPVQSPTKPRSLIGVSHSRMGPYFSYRPTVVLKLPPRAPMPSPTTKMLGSRAISSSRPSRAAAVNVISRIMPLDCRFQIADCRLGSGFRVGAILSPFHPFTLSPFHLVILSPGHLVTWSSCHLVTIDVVRRRGRVGVGAVFGELVRIGDLRLDLGVDLGQFVLADLPVGQQCRVEHLDGVAGLPGLDLLHGAVATVAHALGVRPGAVGLALDQRRAAARAGPPHRRA